MIEIQIWQIFSMCLASLGMGVGIGYKLANKTVSIVDSNCDTPKNMTYGYINIKSIYTNGKRTDIECSFKKENKLCSQTNKKCKYLWLPKLQPLPNINTS